MSAVITPIIRRLFRSFENPATPLSDPDEWAKLTFGGGRASSGVTVNAETALTYAAVYRAVNMISRDVAKLPLVVYRRQGEGKDKDTRHPAYYLLRYTSGPGLTAFEFKRRMMIDALLLGNGYALIVRKGGWRPAELVPLVASQVRVDTTNKRAIYVVGGGGDGDLRIRGEDVLHIRNLGDGYTGKSVVSKAANSMGIGMAAQDYAASFYKNGARPSVAIKHPARIGDEAIKNLRRTWQEIYGGSENAGKPAILEEGMSVEGFSMSNEDAQFLETRQFELREIANWFGVPPHKLGDTTRTAYASLEQENQSYLDDALDGWLVCWEYECREKLFTDPEKRNDTHVVEYTRQALIRTNMADRGQFYAAALQGGWMSRDEIRARENMNPIPDGEGEKFYQPLNMGIAGEEPPDPAPAPAPADIKQAASDMQPAKRPVLVGTHRLLLADLTRRMARRIATHAKKAAKRPDQFMDWLEVGLELDHRGVLLEAAQPVADAIRHALGAPAEQCNAERYLRTFLDAARAELFCATDHPPAELARRVDLIANHLEAKLMAAVTETFFVFGDDP